MSLFDNSQNTLFHKNQNLKSNIVENNDIKNKESLNNFVKDDFNSAPSSSFQDNLASNNIFYIRNIDIDELPPKEISRIIVAVGSKNLAHYLAMIVNLENRSRKISPEIKAKVLSSKNLNSPSQIAEKISILTPILNTSSKENVKK